MKDITTTEEFNKWLKRYEDMNLEFKKSNIDKQSGLPDYCAALANEKGGKLIIGVAEKKGKKKKEYEVVGTRFAEYTFNTLSNELLNKIKIRVDVEELLHPNGRVVIFHVPSRPIGRPIRSTGKYTYPMRAGESLVEMDLTTLKDILNETEPDFSSKIVEGLTVKDLNGPAIKEFKRRWAQKARKKEYARFSDEKTLRAIGVLTKKGINYAGIILFGKKEMLDNMLPCAEIIFEWRQDKAKIAHDFRKTWRDPFLNIHDKIFKTVNERNLRTPFQEGFIQREVYAFNEDSIREAVANAVAHRDYTIGGKSIIIKASPDEFEIKSPGGLPPGITLDNILEEQNPRNRCIAEAFEKAGLAERSGQGMDLIFKTTIEEGKGLPDLSSTDMFSVRLKIPAKVKDKNFILFLEKVAKEKQIIFSFEEIYELEKIREQEVVTKLKNEKRFMSLGIVERIGRTKGSKYILSHKYYSHKEQPGTYTRLHGLSREKIKELIVNHLKKNQKGILKDFTEVFSELAKQDISNILQELKKEKKIRFFGSIRDGYWGIR